MATQIKKKTILFGACAESSFFSSGSQFLMDVLGIQSKKMSETRLDEINNALAQYIEERIKSHDDFYPKFTMESKAFGVDELYEICVRNYYLANHDSKNAIEEKINKKKNNNAKTKKRFIRNHPSYLGLLDSYFFTLIQPKTLGKKKFWRVILCYYRAYLSLVKPFFKKNKKFTNEYILNNPDETYQVMKEECRNIVEKESDSYFSILRNRHDLNFVTTNYTPFGQILSEDCVYLHGRFDLFESPYSRSVVDLSSTKELPSDDLYFPYIFIQSGVKPIVERHQIREYNRFIEYLDSSDVLYVLGYQFNPDDSEIISLVRVFLIKGKKIVYFQYHKNESDETRPDFKKIFRIDDESKIEVKQITGGNISEFKKVINEE